MRQQLRGRDGECYYFRWENHVGPLTGESIGVGTYNMEMDQACEEVG